MIQRARACFAAVSLPTKVLLGGLVIILLSWIPILLYLVVVYGLLGVHDGNPIGLGLLMVFGSMLGGAIAALGLVMLLVSKLTGRSS